MSESADLKKAGLKATLPRLKILSHLEESPERHMSAEDIYKLLLDAGEEVGLATVYRVLTQFEDAGLVIRHHFEGARAVYELNQGHHHDHIVCNQCGKVVEFMEETIERYQEKVARKEGFSIRDHSLIIYGDCTRKNCPDLKKRR